MSHSELKSIQKFADAANYYEIRLKHLGTSKNISSKTLLNVGIGQQKFINILIAHIAALDKRIDFIEETAAQKGTANLNHAQLKKEVLANIPVPSAPMPSEIFGKN